MQIQTIPLSKLTPHPRNVRKTGGTSIRDLACSIAAHGLLHPLVVSPMGDGFEVVAGARRLAAIKALDEDRMLPEQLASGIPCQVMAAGSVTELSLAENVIRQAMHPADEFEAFRALIEQGQTIEAVATRFGVKVRHVEERLRLANVAPELLGVYREGGMTLEQVMALSVVDSYAAQIEAWGTDKPAWDRTPQALRNALVSREITNDDSVAVFVGREAYESAGGTVREDLFSEIVIFEDSALVQRLAMNALKERANQIKCEGWGWVEAMISWSWNERQAYKAVDAPKPMPLLGVVVTISSSGKLEIHRGLLRPGEKVPATVRPKQPKTSTTDKNPMGQVNQNLEAVRLGLARQVLRGCPEAAVAVLVSMMWADYAQQRDDLCGALGFIEVSKYHNAATKAVIDGIDSGGPKAAALWHKKAEAGAKKHGSVLAWLLADEASCADLLAFLAIEAVDLETYDDGDRERMHQALDLLGVDLGEHWQLTPEWLQAQGRAYILAVLDEALGKKAAQTGGWERLKASVLADQAHKALLAAGWLPEPMRVPEVKKPAAKKAAKRRA